jgi:hypothetical protein
MTMLFPRIRSAPMRSGVAVFVLGLPVCLLVSGQEHGGHVREIHGVPGGVPDLCADPSAVSAASGAWSDTATRSLAVIRYAHLQPFLDQTKHPAIGHDAARTSGPIVR